MTDLSTRYPRLIGICGNPDSGKSSVQKILERHHYIPVDDGAPLRQIAIHQFGLSQDDVYTQEGKNRSSTVTGVRMKNREILGRIGNALEKEFGSHILPWLAVQQLDEFKDYSFGSVRRDQGKVYKAEGGVIFGVRRPGCPPSEFEFDRFDESLVDVWIDNDGTLEHLEQKVIWALQEVTLRKMAA